MITLLYIALEAVAVLLLLHALYGKKMRWDKYSVGFVVLDCVLMSVIRFGKMNQSVSMIIYVLLIMYCICEFGTNVKQLVVNMILLAVIMMGIELAALIILQSLGAGIKGYEDISVVFANGIIVLIVLKMYKKLDLYAISVSFQRNGRLVAILLLLESSLVFFLIFEYKILQGKVPVQTIIISGILVLTVILCIHGLLYRIKYQEKQAELEAYKTYSVAFSDLITQIRARQH